jgi:hypothetical protein
MQEPVSQQLPYLKFGLARGKGPQCEIAEHDGRLQLAGCISESVDDQQGKYDRRYAALVDSPSFIDVLAQAKMFLLRLFPESF